MAIYLVTYDLNSEIHRPPIVKRIKESFASWARLSESSYAIETHLTPEAVQQVLRSMIDANDHIYIITLSNPFTGFGPIDVNQWLAQRL